MGDVYDTVGRYEAAIEQYRRAREQLPDPESRLRLSRKIVTVERKAGLSPAPELVARVTSLLEEADASPVERCRLLIELTRLADGKRTEQAAADAVRIAESLDDPLLMASALERLAVSRLFIEGRTDEALTHLRRALEIAFAVQDPVLLARYHAIAGVANAKHGRYRDALGDFEELLAACERMGDPNGIAAACNNLGMVMLRLGVYTDAERMLERARSIHERRDRASVVESQFGLAERARLEGEHGLAIERFRQLLGYAREFQFWRSEAVAHAGIGLSLIQQGRVDEARDEAEALTRVLDSHDQWFEDRDLVELFRARLDAATGAVADAVRRLEQAAAALETRDVFLWARIELESIDLMRSKDPVRAAAALDRVARDASGLQSPVLEARLAALRRETHAA
jgi:tetratricopeptide (TPR) repeat protein